MYVRGGAKKEAFPWASHLYCFDLRADPSAASSGSNGAPRRTGVLSSGSPDQARVVVYDIRGREIKVCGGIDT